MYSVIISTKNNALTLRYVLTSTLPLTEKYDIELIVVDGNSRDNTPNVIKDFTEKYGSLYVSLKVLKDPGISLSYSRHEGFKNSKGDILIFLDGDTLLSTSFKYYLERELASADLISPITSDCIPLDKATKVFNGFMKVLSYTQIDIVTKGENIGDPSILSPARIYKREVLERIKGYPVSSRFFGEDKIATALAVKLGFRYKASTRLKLLKIDEPGYRSYWRKHYRYALGIHRDNTILGRRILRKYIVARRINHVNVIFPVFSIIYGFNAYKHMRSLRRATDIALMKYFVDVAMFLGDLIGALTGR